MTIPVRPPTPHADVQADRTSRGRIVPVICALVLTSGHLVAAYFTLLAYMADPAGPWDSETVAHSNFASGFALLLAAVTAGLCWVFVRAERLGGWWYAVPTALAVAALLRLTLLAPEL